MKMRRWVEGDGRDIFSLVTSREEMEQLNRDNRGGKTKQLWSVRVCRVK